MSSASNIAPMTSGDFRSRRKTSITIGLILGFLVVLFYAVTIVRLKGNVAQRMQHQNGQTVEQVQKPAGEQGASSSKQGH